jgi:hypothetical protein
MVYAFECDRCQVRVYRASTRGTRKCPMCAEPMRAEPVTDRLRALRARDAVVREPPPAPTAPS